MTVNGEKMENRITRDRELENPDNIDIDKNEQNELAGFSPTQPEQEREKHRIVLDEELPIESPVEEKPIPRFLFTATVVGGVLLGLMGLWWLIQPKPPQPIAVQTEIEDAPPEEDTSLDYRGKLALRDQKYAMQPQAKPVPVAQAKPVTAPVRTNTPQKIAAPPSPRVVTAQSNPRSYYPAPRDRFPTIAKAPQVDPYKRWQELANLGQSQGGVLDKLKQSTEETSIASNNDYDRELEPEITRPVTVAKINTNSTNTGIPVVNVGFNSSTDESREESSESPGVRGILTRRLSDRVVDRPQIKEVAFGTTAAGVVSTPVIWDEETDKNSQIQNRFTITLTEDLLATTGEVALSAGTVIVAEAANVNKKNKLVQATAIAIVYQDDRGKTRQIPLEAGAIIIQGENNTPLIAKGNFDRGGEIAKNDLLIATLSGIGKVGKVFTEPKQTSTFSSGSFGGYNSTTVQNRDPKIWAAVLDGFFSPLSERIAERSDAQIEQSLGSPNVDVIAANTKVSIFVNSFFRIK
jgi:hypothetical protein